MPMIEQEWLANLPSLMMKHISDKVLVMHQGEVVERGGTADVLASPLHDLTRRLISSHFGEALSAEAWRRER